jgi:hypothetical protein
MTLILFFVLAHFATAVLMLRTWDRLLGRR